MKCSDISIVIANPILKMFLDLVSLINVTDNDSIEIDLYFSKYITQYKFIDDYEAVYKKSICIKNFNQNISVPEIEQIFFIDIFP